MDDEWTDDEPDDELDIVVKSDSEDEGGIEATPEPEPEPEPKPKPVKPKKKMSEKQLAALAAGRAKRDVGRNARKVVKNEKLAIRKANLEKRTIQKAIALKKREAIEEAALVLSDEDSVDELEVKQVKRLVAKRKARAKAKPKTAPQKQAVEQEYSQPPQPQFVFY
tara:strand:+ start:4088 stop:4585 length:498 start_codon:yes stop_codon:yes gene_type:complete